MSITATVQETDYIKVHGHIQGAQNSEIWLNHIRSLCKTTHLRHFVSLSGYLALLIGPEVQKQHHGLVFPGGLHGSDLRFVEVI